MGPHLAIPHESNVTGVRRTSRAAQTMRSRARSREIAGVAKAAPARSRAHAKPPRSGRSRALGRGAPLGVGERRTIAPIPKLPIRSSPLIHCPRFAPACTARQETRPEGACARPRFPRPRPSPSPCSCRSSSRGCCCRPISTRRRRRAARHARPAGAGVPRPRRPGQPPVVTTAAVAPIQRTNELVFVDTATPDYQPLVEAMRDSRPGRGPATSSSC